MQSLRVLLYHSVSGKGRRDNLTVDTQQLEQQFQYLRSKGYTTILLSELIACCEGNQSLPPRPVLITFDDGFLDNYEIAYPLARKYGMKINLFLVPSFMLKGEYRGERCLRAEEARKMDPSLVEFGLHSYAHSSYTALGSSQVGADIERCRSILPELGIGYQPCLAYPYGAYPRRKGLNQDRFFEMLEEQGIRLAFRIGNRINRMPVRHPFLIQRLDIRGDEPMAVFKVSLVFGKKLLGLAGLARFLSGMIKRKREPAIKA